VLVSAKHNISTAAVAAQDPAIILSPVELREAVFSHWYTTDLRFTGWKRPTY